jgi:hypothetical protein
VQLLDLGDDVLWPPRPHGCRAVERVVDVLEICSEGRRTLEQAELHVELIEQLPEPSDPQAAVALVLEGSDAADDDQLAVPIEKCGLDVDEVHVVHLHFLPRRCCRSGLVQDLTHTSDDCSEGEPLHVLSTVALFVGGVVLEH